MVDEQLSMLPRLRAFAASLWTPSRRTARIIGLAALFVGGCRADVNDLAIPGSTTGTLAVAVDSMPTGVAASIVITNSQGFRRVLPGPAELADLPPGTYTVTVADIVSGDQTWTAVPAVQSITVGASRTAVPVSITFVRSGAQVPGAIALAVTGLPTGVPAPIQLVGPGGVIKQVSGSAAVDGLKPGYYNVAAADVTTDDSVFVAQPTSQVLTVTSGGTVSATVAYLGASLTTTTGTLNVTMSGLPTGVGGSIVVAGPGGFSQWFTTSHTMTNLAVGTYTVTTGPLVAGGVSYSPSPLVQSVAVTGGNTSSVAVAYAPPAAQSPTLGSLSLSITGLPAGAGGSVTISGSGGYFQWLTAGSSFSNLVPGDFTVTAGNVTVGGVAYTAAPALQLASVTAGATAAVTVAYASASQAPPAGALNVTIAGLPAGVAGSATVTGPGGFTRTIGTTQTISPVVAGSYGIAAASVTSGGVTYTAQPASQVIQLASGGTASATVTYAPVTPPPPTVGALSVSVTGLPSGALASVAVSGPGAYFRAITGSSTLDSLAAGSYSVAAGNVTVAGTTYAPQATSQLVAVYAGSAATASVAYAAVVTQPLTGTLTVAISGVPAGSAGNVTVTGPGGFSQVLTTTQTLTGRTAGTYVISAATVTSGGFTYAPSPSSQTQVVVGGGTAAVSVAYAATKGNLSVTLAGLPAGATGSVTVAGPGGYFQWFSTSQALTALTPGTYVVTGGNVTSGGSPYTAAPASQSVVVTAGVTGTATVTYSGGAVSTVGTLAVTISGLPTGGAGSVTVTGPSSFAQWFTTSQTFGSLAAGSYTIVAANVTVSGTTYAPSPASQVKSVTSGATTTASVVYAAVTSSTSDLTVNVNGLPAGVSGNVSVTSLLGFSRLLTATQSLTGLPLGTYTVTASNIVSGGVTYTPSPATQTALVVLGSSVATTVTYAAVGGTGGFGPLSPGFQGRSMVVEGVTYKYQIFVPQGYTPTKSWPVILFLHGSGESGSDGLRQTTVGLGAYVAANAATFPAIVVFPQVPALTTGPIIQLADSINKAALNLTLAEVRADSLRIYLTGLSQGGDLSWDIDYAAPTKFAAVVPIAGSICGTCVLPGSGLSQSAVVSRVVQRLVTLPIWIFHGGSDPLVSPVDDRSTYAAFRAAGSPIKYTEYAGMGHNVWDITYADPSLWTWLFAQHR